MGSSFFRGFQDCIIGPVPDYDNELKETKRTLARLAMSWGNKTMDEKVRQQEAREDLESAPPESVESKRRRLLECNKRVEALTAVRDFVDERVGRLTHARDRAEMRRTMEAIVQYQAILELDDPIAVYGQIRALNRATQESQALGAAQTTQLLREMNDDGSARIEDAHEPTVQVVALQSEDDDGDDIVL